MSNEQINIKIAELCGWKGPFQQEWIPEYGRAAEPFYCFAGTDEDGDRYPIPNYAADLNACHEFEKTLDTYELAEYWHNLLRAHEHIPVCSGCSDARQRCEAFLRVHGQWEEEA